MGLLNSIFTGMLLFPNKEKGLALDQREIVNDSQVFGRFSSIWDTDGLSADASNRSSLKGGGTGRRG